MIFYFIVTTSRTGSSLLVEYLQSLKKFGFPDENIRRYYQEYEMSLVDAVDKIYDETNTNNIAGDKTLIRLVYSYLQSPSKRPYDYKYIFWKRRDILAQSISIYRARESGLWHIRNNEKKQNPKIIFDKNKILEFKKIIDTENNFAEEMFNKYKIKPLRLYYEDLISNQNEVIKNISDYIGVPFDENSKPQSTLCVTRDDLTEEWLNEMRKNN